MFSHSLRWRLQIWHGIMLLVVLTGFGFTAYRLQIGSEFRRVDQELQQRLGPIRDSMRRPPPGRLGRPGRPGFLPPRDGVGRPAEPSPEDLEEGPPPRGLKLSDGVSALFSGTSNAYYYAVWLRDGSELSRSESAPQDLTRPPRNRSDGPTPTVQMRGNRREVYQFIRAGECLLVGRSVEPEIAGLRQFALMLTTLGGAVLAFGLAGGWWLASKAIRPIDDISAAASQIANGDLSHRISVADTDNELGQLADVLNLTFARLEAAFVRQQQFTADASHELRTPVSVILSQTQATLARERTLAEYQEALAACQRAAERMRTLTESLLILARLDSGQETMRREPVDLSETAMECLDLLRPLAREKNVSFDCAPVVAKVTGDSERMAQVITNLLTNAIAHSGKGGTVTVTTGVEDGCAYVAVADTGAGIPAEDLPRIFERFYRADPSRSGAKSGTGLGLAIAKAIVEAHGGRIEASSTVGLGTTFRVSIPAAND